MCERKDDSLMGVWQSVLMLMKRIPLSDSISSLKCLSTASFCNCASSKLICNLLISFCDGTAAPEDDDDVD